MLIQASGLKRALTPYTLAGPYGRLLDGDHEAFGASDAQAFETEGLIGTPAAPAVLAYLFHRIGRRLDGQPTLILIDEGWLALDDPLFGRQLKEWLKTLRKKNASVVFATQSLADIEGSAITPAIIESCPTRLFLANERALEPQIAGIYRRFGLNDRQIEIIASATPKRDYYCQSAAGNRLFDLGLGPVALGVHRRLVAPRYRRDRRAARRARGRWVRRGMATPSRPRLGRRPRRRRHRSVPRTHPTGDRRMNRRYRLSRLPRALLGYRSRSAHRRAPSSAESCSIRAIMRRTF